jgi:hypothetical protein
MGWRPDNFRKFGKLTWCSADTIGISAATAPRVTSHTTHGLCQERKRDSWVRGTGPQDFHPQNRATSTQKRNFGDIDVQDFALPSVTWTVSRRV